MIRFREAELLEKPGWTRYPLAKDVGITELAVYRLAVPGRALQRIDAATLEKLCEVFGVGVGDVLETVADRAATRKRGRCVLELWLAPRVHRVGAPPLLKASLCAQRIGIT